MIEIEKKEDLTIESENLEKEEVKNELATIAPKGKKKKGQKSQGQNEKKDSDEYQDFPDMAALLNTTVKALKEEFYLFQIRKLMSHLKRVVVRYDVTETEIKEMLTTAKYLHSGGLNLAPVYLPACAKQIKKNGISFVNIGSVIDFPFGESTFKSKLSGIKESVKMGANEVTVAIPSMLLGTGEIKNFKKQIKKLGRIKKVKVGVSLNASDLDEDKIKLALKIINKLKLNFITFAFGDATLIEVKNKLGVINKYRSAKPVCVLANVDRAEAVTELFKLKVDYIITPYSDDIGDDLLKRFNLKIEN